MRCPVLEDDTFCVRASDDDAAQKIAALRDAGSPVTLVLRQPADADLIRAASYHAKNTLHVFAKAGQAAWCAPFLALAGRCGIASTVALYPVIPGDTSCADVLECVASLSVNYRMTFLFMFPRVNNSRHRNARLFAQGPGGYGPSADYMRAFQRKVHKYFDCTPHVCGICGKDCSLCMREQNRVEYWRNAKTELP